MDRKDGTPRKLMAHYLEQVSDDQRLLPSHIGLVLALYYFHNENCPLDYFHASRRKLMRFSRIRSIATYHKCLSQLKAYGHLDYIPSWHPKQASRFRFIIRMKGGEDA